MREVIECNTLAENSENILRLANTDTYMCQIQRYMIGHSVLIINARKINIPASNEIFIVFESVSFLSAPMSWQGLNLCVASMDEYGRIMHKVQSKKKLTPSDFPDTYNLDPTKFGKLLFVEATNLRIDIICNLITVTNDVSSLI
jgi:hypothetical protein